MKCDSPINTNICELLDRPNPLHRQKIQCKWIKFIFHLKILNKIHKAVNTEKYSHSNPNNNMPGDNPEVYSTQVHNHKVREVCPEVDDTRVHNSIVREVNLEVDGTRVHYKTVRGPVKATEQIRRPKAEPAVVTEQISRLTAEPVVVTEQMKSLTAGLVMVAVAKGVQRTTMWKVAEECGRGKTRRRYKNHNRLSRLLRGSCRLWS